MLLGRTGLLTSALCGALLLIATALLGCPPFCGSSTHAECETDDECVAGGCSGQLCGHEDEDLISTCEWRACYETDRPGLACGCYDGECQWSR
jgi:eight-cysteine-cluster-containing protein